MINNFRIIIERICNFFAIFNGVLLIAIAFLTGADVASSAFWRSPIPGTIEISILILPWVICGGLAYALAKKIHVRVTLITDRLNVRMTKVADIFAHLCGMIFCIFLTIGGWLHFYSSWIIKEPMFAALLTLPAWLGKLALPIGFFFTWN